MKEIKLNQNSTKSKYHNLAVMVDDEDYDRLYKHKWHVVIRGNGSHYYARRWETQGRAISMHREILGLSNDDKRVVDHIDHNPLNNQKNNLRICTVRQNSINRKGSGTSKYLGVCWRVFPGKWLASIKAEGKTKFLGEFNNEDDAARCYDMAARNVHGEFANLNFKH